MSDKKRVLLVDDEVAITNAMQMYLEKIGNYEVRTENKGTAVLDVVREFRPDLVLLDIILPDIDGTTIAAQIKESPDLQHIPIVFLTATMSREEVGVQGNVIGDHRVLAKPVNPKTIVECIDNTLGE